MGLAEDRAALQSAVREIVAAIAAELQAEENIGVAKGNLGSVADDFEPLQNAGQLLMTAADLADKLGQTLTQAQNEIEQYLDRLG
jgi:hypothetical protein